MTNTKSFRKGDRVANTYTGEELTVVRGSVIVGERWLVVQRRDGERFTTHPSWLVAA